MVVKKGGPRAAPEFVFQPQPKRNIPASWRCVLPGDVSYDEQVGLPTRSGATAILRALRGNRAVRMPSSTRMSGRAPPQDGGRPAQRPPPGVMTAGRLAWSYCLVDAFGALSAWAAVRSASTGRSSSSRQLAPAQFKSSASRLDRSSTDSGSAWPARLATW